MEDLSLFFTKTSAVKIINISINWLESKIFILIKNNNFRFNDEITPPLSRHYDTWILSLLRVSEEREFLILFLEIPTPPGQFRPSGFCEPFIQASNRILKTDDTTTALLEYRSTGSSNLPLSDDMLQPNWSYKKYVRHWYVKTKENIKL